MQIIIIVAMTADRLIGRQGRLPWHEPEDLRHFKRTTTGHAVIMGRKTFEAVGRPLPGRRNIAVTRNERFAASGVDVVHSLDAALELCRRRGEQIAYVIGGAQIFAQAMPLADEMIVTWIDRPEAVGDTFFPPWDPKEWAEEPLASPGGLRIARYRRVRPNAG